MGYGGGVPDEGVAVVQGMCQSHLPVNDSSKRVRSKL